MAYREPSTARAILVDFDSAIPLYRQIADGVRALIATGSLAAGDALPSVRKLGGMLGVNLNTVAKAYRVLAEERVVELKQGAPARVAESSEHTPFDEEEMHGRIDAWVGRMRLGGASEEQTRELFERAVARFFVNEGEQKR